jgi:hypothetical protein
MPELPIEIKPSDIIKRPLDVAIKAATGAKQEGGFSLKNIKGYIDQIKEIKELAEGFGLDLSSFGLKMPGQKKGGGDALVPTGPPAIGGGQQVRNFLKLLQARYGDITVTELLEKLKTEFGDWKISNFTKGGLV